MSNRKADNYSSRTADKFVVRLPDGVRERTSVIARDQHRSMNSQIIVWLQACIELEEQGIKVSPATISAAANEQKGPRIVALETMLKKLLESGDWYTSAIELDRFDGKVDGNELEREVRELLANDAPIKPVMVEAEKPKFVPREGMPVMYEENRRLIMGVIDEIYVERTSVHAFTREFYRAKLRVYGGGNAYVDLDKLSEPLHEKVR